MRNIGPNQLYEQKTADVLLGVPRYGVLRLPTKETDDELLRMLQGDVCGLPAKVQTTNDALLGMLRHGLPGLHAQKAAVALLAVFHHDMPGLPSESEDPADELLRVL